MTFIGRDAQRFAPGRTAVVGAHGRAEDGIRTRGLLITNQLLYQLSYPGKDAAPEYRPRR